MVFHVVAVGRVQEAVLRTACDDYLRRARRAAKILVHEVAAAGRAGSTPVVARRLEGERLQRATPDGVVQVALTRTGRAASSEEFARLVGRWRDGARDVAFLVGGAHGLPDEMLAHADLTLSLSSMTLPHEVARLVLFEQLYRAGTILRGEPYHKGRRT
ncbi:MAG: 23S rRNA (pseudouridine(1915)-N(3))-methyltransferase RlmH [Gemmatimonadota bacterium]|nr:23S rRNA (pseudouridine(1915)-N(3))-methyltransferase RlmH [Gemmatimonadota bacterium]MDH4352215.1 23S rRNA (pseudouridine(1915)-N(3))-methyltransferase RlmH [Gemmatimonadota bacterium]MDH5196747.1 23S rRNA (pseudouridine(1915)-N(3))-methyltransferase RlmH [Gemmatimonadota bacterium]